MVRWLVAALASALAHAGLVLLILRATQPDPVLHEPSEPARLAMTAEAVRTDRAEPAEPEAPRADATDSGGDALATAAGRSDRAAPLPPTGVAVPAPQSDAAGGRAAALTAAAPPALSPPPRAEMAEPAPLSADRLDRAAPASETVAAAAPVTARVASAAAAVPALAPQTPQGPAIAPAKGEAVALVASRSDPVPAAAQVPDGARVGPAVAPAAPASSATPDAVRMASVDSGGQIAPAARPPAPRLDAANAAAPHAPRQPARGSAPPAVAASRVARAAPAAEIGAIAHLARASLAWAGGEQVTFDAQSLATVQSFMAPRSARDSGLHAGDARDGIADLLASYPCSRLEAAFVPETGALEIRGHVPDPALRGAVEDRLRAAIGGAIGVGNDLLVLPEPQCALLGGIAALGLPQSTDQTGDPLVVGQSAQASIFTFSGGERLQITLGAADYDAHVYLDYFDAEGNVLHLIPSEHVDLSLHPAKRTLVLGDDPADFGGFEPIVGPPYGRDIVVALAASVPLYDGVRPLVEPAAPYLGWLAERIAERRSDPGFRGEWVYFFVDTFAPNSR